MSMDAISPAGADPATASSIFLPTASDVTNMGIFLSVASVTL
jgi:magnesium transporter